MTQLEVRDIFPSTFQTKNHPKPEDSRELVIGNRVQGEDCVPWRQDRQAGGKGKSWGSGVCLPKVFIQAAVARGSTHFRWPKDGGKANVNLALLARWLNLLCVAPKLGMVLERGDS